MDRSSCSECLHNDLKRFAWAHECHAVKKRCLTHQYERPRTSQSIGKVNLMNRVDQEGGWQVMRLFRSKRESFIHSYIKQIILSLLPLWNWDQHHHLTKDLRGKLWLDALWLLHRQTLLCVSCFYYSYSIFKYIYILQYTSIKFDLLEGDSISNEFTHTNI